MKDIGNGLSTFLGLVAIGTVTDRAAISMMIGHSESDPTQFQAADTRNQGELELGGLVWQPESAYRLTCKICGYSGKRLALPVAAAGVGQYAFQAVDNYMQFGYQDAVSIRRKQ